VLTAVALYLHTRLQPDLKKMEFGGSDAVI
jgi:hypothetical protein